MTGWIYGAFVALIECEAISLPKVAEETASNWRAVSKYLAADDAGQTRKRAPGRCL